MKDRGLLNKVATNLPFVTNIVVEIHNKAKHACTKKYIKILHWLDWGVGATTDLRNIRNERRL